jgi:hypothetical protein
LLKPVKERIQAAVCALTLFALNVYIARDLFTVEYTRFMGSIEGAHVGVARQLAESWDSGWWPLWYGGIPFQNTYPPLLHWITALFALVMHVSPAYSDHAVTTFFYCAGPVTLFWMAHRLSAGVWPSFAGALVYSLVSSAAVLIPEVRRDVDGVFHPRRLQALVMYGEGPHITSMMLLPLAIVLLDIALVRRRPVFYVLAALGLASVALTNWLGTFALAAAVVAYILSRERSARIAALVKCSGIAILAYALAARWLPPSNLAVIRGNEQRTAAISHMAVLHLAYVAILAAGLILACLWLDKRNTPVHLRFFAFFAFFMSAITLSSAWLRIPLVPQPGRYHLEMEMALTPLIVFALAVPLGRLPRVPRALVVLGFAVFCYLHIRPNVHYVRDLVKPIDVRDTSEYKVAAWFDHNMAGRRVCVPGSEYFWLNAFTDTPQLAGGFDQGMTNPLLPHVLHQLFSGEGNTREGELGALWLKAFGVHAVAVSGPRSTEVYKPYHNWQKFEGVLPVLWRDGDDIIYRVLSNSVSLAHVLRPEDRLTREPASVLDLDFAKTYVARLENSEVPPAGMTWVNRHHAVITADLRGGQLLLVQVTYHPAWHARVNGAPGRVTKDPIGLMLIDPGCTGRCVVDLDYEYDAERLITTLTTWLALIGCIVWILFRALRVRYWSHEFIPGH